ncbi:MAG: FHA domain-containing protein [Methylomagnum sp.]
MEPGETSIGRDPSNIVHIDSLAVADFHAVILASSQGYVLKKANPKHSLYVNDEAVAEEKALHNGDIISIGKHSIHFVHLAEKTSLPESAENHRPRTAEVSPHRFRRLEGNFQVMNGKRIGMVIPLKGAVTQIGKEPSGMVKVSRTEEGYTIEAGSAEVLLTINGIPVTNGEAPLHDGDVVRINSALLQFFHK